MPSLLRTISDIHILAFSKHAVIKWDLRLHCTSTSERRTPRFCCDELEQCANRASSDKALELQPLGRIELGKLRSLVSRAAATYDVARDNIEGCLPKIVVPCLIAAVYLYHNGHPQQLSHQYLQSLDAWMHIYLYNLVDLTALDFA